MMSATFVTFSKETSPSFSDHFYSIKLTIKLRTSCRLNGKQTTGGVLVFYRHVIVSLIKGFI